MKVSDLLGLNARNQLFSYKYNKPFAKKKAISKLSSKKALIAAGIPVPEILAKFIRPRQVLTFNFSNLPGSFALKPSRGMGGEGIVIAKKRQEILIPSKFGDQGNKPFWITTQREKIGVEDLNLHVLDILEGAYSIGNVPDVAFIEEYVGRHKAFRKYSFRGTPDIRVIVFNKVPVMAMLRLPTKESGGRANLHQGAIGVGIDIATGITTKAYLNGEYILYKPGTKRKLNGIKIPFWEDVLKIASLCQIATNIGYLGVDLILHPEKGPMVLELNCQPGLSIQLANGAGLKRRLDRVDDLHVRDAEHGVKIAKALFMSTFSDRVKAKEGVKTLSPVEEIIIRGHDKQKVRVLAKLDTGAWRTSISYYLAEKLGLLSPDNILWKKKFKSALGEETRPVISLSFKLAGRRIITPASVAKRMTLKYPVIIGRKNLKGFLINPEIDTEAAKK